MSIGEQGAREEVFHGGLIFSPYISRREGLGLQVNPPVSALRLQGYPRQGVPGFQKIPKDPGTSVPQALLTLAGTESSSL